MRKMNQRERKILNAGRTLVDRVKNYAEEIGVKYHDSITVTYVGIDWVGSYGLVGELNMKTQQIEFDECLKSWGEEKKASNLVQKKKNRIFYKIENDTIESIIVFSYKSKIGFYGKFNTPIIVMENSQLFDCENLYWFTVKDSKELLSDLERGYNYFDPQEFFRDSFDCNETRLLQSDLTKFEAEKYEGGEWKNLGRISVREFWDVMKWVDYIKVGDVVYSYDDYYHELNRDSFDPDKSYSFNEYDDYEEEEL